MNRNNDTARATERKRGSHLTEAERGMIQALHREGMSLRKIGSRIGVAHTTVFNELKRGTPQRKGKRGRQPDYSALRGEEEYRRRRRKCRRKFRAAVCTGFVNWCVSLFHQGGWSLDACVGFVRRTGLFAPSDIICTKTLYSAVKRELVKGILFMDLPEAVSRKPRVARVERKNKRVYGTSISERDEIVDLRTEFGHWEGDTVVGLRDGKNAVLLTLLEKKTRLVIVVKIKDKTASSVMSAMEDLRKKFGDKFCRVFKSITVDNGSEFSDFARMGDYGVKVYFAHPHAAYERGQNERCNRMLRTFFPKGTQFNEVSDEEVMRASSRINSLPRRGLGYRTPAELFAEELKQIQAA